MLLRSIRSVYDYISFFEIKLSPSPKRYVVALLALIIVSASTSLFAPRNWGPLADWALLIAALGYVLKLLSNLWSPNRAPKFLFQAASDLEEEIKRSKPCVADEERGFRAVPPGKGVFGAVHLSKDFNIACMANPDWDIPIDNSTATGHYETIISGIRKHRLAFRQEGLRTVLKKLFDGKALINESKIGIACDFHTGMKQLNVYRSSYLATWCSGDLAHRDIIEKTSSGKRIYSLAKDRVPFDQDGRFLRLRPLSTSSQRISAQFGINFLGVTKDRILLIAIQGRKTMVGQNKRVSLATGSMDWEDRQKASTLKELGRIAATRELREEWGKNARRAKEEPLAISDFLPLGVFRVPDRSGKPEFAAIGCLNWTEDELQPDKTEVESWEDQGVEGRARVRYSVETFEQFAQAVKALLSQHGGAQDTTPLFGVLTCLQDLIDEDPDRLRSALNYP